jgi:hypothetical protein
VEKDGIGNMNKTKYCKLGSGVNTNPNCHACKSIYPKLVHDIEHCPYSGYLEN